MGSAPDLRTEGQRDRSAVLDVMGMGDLSQTTKAILFGLGVLILVAAIVAFLILST